MTDTLKIKRRVGGAQSAPTGANNEGELALYFPGAAGGTDTPTLYANDGGGWRVVNGGGGGIDTFDPTKSYAVGDLVLQAGNIYQAPSAIPAAAFNAASWTKITNTVTPTVVGHAATSTAATVEAAWNADTVNVVPGEIAIYTYSGTAYVYTGPAKSPATGATASMFTPLGAATPFATAADATTGTDTGKAVNSKVLRDELARALGPVTAALLLGGTGATATPDATPANDANKLVALDAAGKIDTGFMSITGITFKGAVDGTGAPPAGPFSAGDLYFNNKAGAANAGWTGVTGTLSNGDMLIYDGAKWAAIAAETDLAKYLPLAGGTMTAGDTTKVTFAPAKTDGTVVALDLGQGAIDNAWIDCGGY